MRGQVYQPKNLQTSQTSSDSGERKKLILRLQTLKGSLYTSPNGVKGTLCQNGIYCHQKKTMVPYEDCGDHPGMTLEQLREVTRDNEKHIKIPSENPMTREEGIEVIEKLRAAGEARKVKLAEGLWGRYFARRLGPLPGQEPIREPTQEELDEIPEPPLDEEIPF